MATNRQIEANRRNAQKCCGPKTETGRATSSQNALKTGLDAKSDVLRFESRPEYRALIAAFHDRFHPTNPEECSLVDMLIRSEWLLRRYTRIETAVWERGLDQSDESLGVTFLRSQDAFERVARRINSAQRNYQVALKQLLDLRAKSAAPEPAAAESETEPVNPKLVSFLPRTPQAPAPAQNNQPTAPEHDDQMTKNSTNPPPIPAATQHLRPAASLCTLNWSLAQFTLPPIYPILDTATLSRLNFPVITAAEAMLEAGARILQFRHKGFWSRETFALAEAINALCKSAGVPFVVNDRADYAAALGTGLHVGQDDLTPADARRVIGAHSILGHSTHNPEQLRTAEQNGDTIDYLAFGPMFTTLSKEHPGPTVGIAGLQAIRALTRKPLVAIGGITRDNALTCWNAGADSVAVIADLYPNPCTKITLRDRMTEWQKLTPAR